MLIYWLLSINLKEDVKMSSWCYPVAWILHLFWIVHTTIMKWIWYHIVVVFNSQSDITQVSNIYWRDSERETFNARKWSNKKIYNPWINALLPLDIHSVQWFWSNKETLKWPSVDSFHCSLDPLHHGLHSDTHRKWCSTPVKALVECISGWGRTNNQTSSSAEQTSWNLSHNCNTTHLRATLWHRKDKQRGSFLLSKNRELFKS